MKESKSIFSSLRLHTRGVNVVAILRDFIYTPQNQYARNIKFINVENQCSAYLK